MLLGSWIFFNIIIFNMRPLYSENENKNNSQLHHYGHNRTEPLFQIPMKTHFGKALIDIAHIWMMSIPCHANFHLVTHGDNIA